MIRAKRIGPDRECRTHFGTFPAGWRGELAEEHVAFVRRHLAAWFSVQGGEYPEPEKRDEWNPEFVRTKPARPGKK